MKPTLQQQKGQEFLVTIYTKAWVDKNFKQELIKNPVKTLNKFTGKKVNFPIDKTLVIEDQTNSNYIYLNIPAKPNLENVELSKEQLEMIAGGNKPWYDVLGHLNDLSVNITVNILDESGVFDE